MRGVPTRETLYERWERDEEIPLYEDDGEPADDEQLLEPPFPQKEFSD